MLQLLSLLTVVSLALGLLSVGGSQESYAKSAVKKAKKAAVTANSKITKTEKKFSELDGNRTDRWGNDLHSAPSAGRALQSH